MRVHVILRGGVGDIMLYMLKFSAIQQKHKNDMIYCYLSSPWPNGCRQLIMRHTGMFKEIIFLKYSRPAPIEGIPERDVTYNFDVWDSENNCLRSIENLYPELDINWFPHLQYYRSRHNMPIISFQPIGRSWGDVWGPEKWREYLEPLKKDFLIYLLGEHKGFDLNEYANAGHPIETISGIVNTISHSQLFIGIDSGFKNIALAQMVPTILIWARQSEVINCIVDRDTWFPPFYQYLDWIRLHNIFHIELPFSIRCKEIFNRKKTAIIIPVFNQLEYTQKCYDSILRNTKRPYKLIFVNNGSTDGTREWLESLEDVTVINNEENLGFAKAVNKGMALVTDEDIMLLNNDVLVPENWLERLRVELYSGREIGVVGPVTNHSGTEGQTMRARPHYKSREADHVSGFCYYIKNRVFRDVGYFNEKYFLAGEDYDYTERVKQAGYKILLVRSLFVHHYGHITANGLKGADMHWRKSRKMFLEDWGK